AEALAQRGQALLAAACQSGDDPAACPGPGAGADEDDDADESVAAKRQAALAAKCAAGQMQVCDWLAPGRAARLEGRDALQAGRELDDACAAGSARSCLQLALAEAAGRRVSAEELAAAGEAD